MIRTVRTAFYVTLVASALYVAGAWGAQDFNGSTEWGESSTVEVSAAPMTICAWGNADNATGNHNAVGVSKEGGSTTEYFILNWSGAVAGDPIRAVVAGELIGSPSIFGIAATTTGYSAGTWHHGCTVFASSTSRSAYIDGGSKGSNTDDRTPSGVNRTSIGTAWSGGSGGAPTRGAAFSGHVAEVGIWNVALTDDEVATLAKGYAPPCVRRNALVAYYPMVRDATSLKDLFSATANHLTLTGGTVSDHPPGIINCQ